MRGAAREVPEEDRAQLRRRERLGHEVIATGLDRPCTIGWERERGDGDDRNARGPRLGAERAREAPAIHPRKQKVDQDRVGPLDPRKVETGHAVDGGEGFVTRRADDP